MAAIEEAAAAAPAGLIGRIRGRLAGRSDSEHEQALIRIAFTFLIALYIWAASTADADPGRYLLHGLSISVVALVLSLAVFAHILWRPQVNPARRIFGMLIDTAGVNGVMLVGGMTAAPFYPILLWIIFGHGFRFGRRYLFAASGAAIVLFGLVVFLNPSWRQVPALDVALVMALVVLPAYVSTLLGKLENALRRAEDASKAKSLFLAMVSHEFRTPLNAVIGFAELLRREERDDDRSEMLGTVLTAARTILEMVEAVLDAAKLDAGKFAVVAVPYDLHRLLGILRGLLEQQAQARSLWLRLVLDPTIPPFLQGDTSSLQRVLTNLIANALKFTETGGVTIRVRRVVAADGSARVAFAVEDTGVGIAPERQRRIFETFTQAEDTTDRFYGGTGLGLTIAKSMVALMGGQLSLQSEVGSGTTFSFDLPLRPVEAAELPALPAQGTVAVLGRGPSAARAHAAIRAAGFTSQPAADLGTAVLLLRRANGRRLLVLAEPETDDPAEVLDIVARRGETSLDIVVIHPPGVAPPPFALAGVATDSVDLELPVLVRAALAPHQDQPTAAALPPIALYPAHILVAEDNLTNQQLVRRILEWAGHDVVIVGSGLEAVDRIAVERFDLVLMDLNMPGMGGIDALKLLRFSEDELPPVVALTADVTDPTIEACRAVGFSDYAKKPIDMTALLALIDRQIEAHRPAQPVHRPEVHRSAAPPVLGPTRSVSAGPPARLRSVVPLGAGDGPPALDRRKLDGLAILDHGDGFVDELIDTFIMEAKETVAAIEVAARQGNSTEIHDLAHALRSSAAHVGATGLFDVLLSWRGLDDAALLARGPAEVQRLRLEFDRAAAGLNAWREEQGFSRVSVCR